MGMAPASMKIFLTFASASALPTASDSLAITGAGVPLGAKSPNHPLKSKSGRFSASATVGTSGSSGERTFEVTASARSRPSFRNGAATGVLMKPI